MYVSSEKHLIHSEMSNFKLLMSTTLTILSLISEALCDAPT